MKKRYNIVSKMMEFAADIKLYIILLIVTTVVSIPVSMISPYAFGYFIDTVLGKKQFDSFIYVIYALIAVYVFKLILDGINLYLNNTITNKFTFRLRSTIWKNYMNFPYSTFVKYNAGDMKMRLIDDINAMGGFISEQVIGYIMNIFVFTFNAAMLLYINYKLAIGLMLLIPAFLWINRIIAKVFEKNNELMREKMGEYCEFEHNSLKNWKEIKISVKEKTSIEKFKFYRDEIVRIGYKWIVTWFFNEVNMDFKANYLCNILLYFVGAIFVIAGQISVGSLMMFISYYVSTFNSIDSLVNIHLSLKINYPFYKRIFEILDIYAYQKDKRNKITEDFNSLEINNLDFKYNDMQENVLNNLNFTINKGDKVVIYGKSGCGKTTLMKLICGLNQHDIGEIKINGIDKKEVNDKSLDRIISTVLQNGYLFNTTIRDNFKIAKNNITDDEIMNVCKYVNMHEFIMRQPDGLDTIIGQNGVKLSGGQRQRFLIAISLVCNTQLLILDEATASIDNINETYIINNIIEKFPDITIIMITHKPELLNKFDIVYEMKNGSLHSTGKGDLCYG